MLIVGVAVCPRNPLLSETLPLGRTPANQTVDPTSKRLSARFGYIDQHGNVVIKPQFDNAMDFSGGMAGVLLNGKWGYIDRGGTIVIRPQFSEAGDFSEGLASVAIGGKWGYIDRHGAVVIPLQFDSARPFAEDRAVVEVNEKWGYIDTRGKYIVQPQFKGGLDFSEGLAAVCAEQPDEQALLTRYYWMAQQCAWGYLDKAGKFAIKPQFNNAQSFSEGLAGVQIGWRWGYINKAGAVVIKPQFDRAEPFSEGLAFAQGGGISAAFLLQEGKVFTSWGYIDTTGKWVIRSRLHYYYAGRFTEGLTQAQRGTGGLWGYVNRKGELVIKPQYKYAGHFSEGLALASAGSECTYIDTTGKTRIQLHSRWGRPFAEGLAVYSSGPDYQPAERAVDKVAFERSLHQAQALLEQGQYSKAVDGFMTAASVHRENCPECALGQAEAWAGLHAYGMASMECDEFFKLTSPDKDLNVRAHALKGEAFINTVEPKEHGRLQMGESELRLALEMDPQLKDPHYNLGFALLKEGRDEEGIKELKAYLVAEQNGARAEQARWFIANPSLARERFAPYFSLTTLQGEHFTTINLRGKVVLLDFWATWCPPCVESVPALVKLKKDFSGEEFVLIGISSDRNKARLEQFIHTKGMDWPEYWEPDDVTFRGFATKSNYGIPNFVLIDRNGIIRDQRSSWGPFYYSSLKSKIHRLLREGAGPSVSVPR